MDPSRRGSKTFIYHQYFASVRVNLVHNSMKPLRHGDVSIPIIIPRCWVISRVRHTGSKYMLTEDEAKNMLKRTFLFSFQKITRSTDLSLIHIPEPTRLRRISYAVFCLKKKKMSTIPLSDPTKP